MDFKRRKTSELWTFFEPVSTDTALCKQCKCKFSLKGSTSNLKKHLQRKHPTINLGAQAVNINNETPVIIIEAGSSSLVQSTNTDCAVPVMAVMEMETNDMPRGQSTSLNQAVKPSNVKRQTTLSSFIPKKITVGKKNKIDSAILNMIAFDFQPFTMVEDKGFQALMNVCAPNYKIPSRKYFSNTLLPAQFEEKSGDLKTQLREQAPSVCLTTDSWTSPVNDSYTAVTVHYIDEAFQMKSYLLECAESNESHTSQYLATEILRVVDEWGLTNKVSIVITDNASNITSAVQKELKWKHFGCYAHTINLVVQDALQNIDTLVRKVKAIVTFFKRSNAATQKLLKYQQQTGVKQPKKLLQDVATRWNSTYFMLERFYFLEEAIKHALALVNNELQALNQEEWVACKQACSVLEPFFEVTKVMSTESYVSASKVIPITSGLKSTLSKISPDVTNEKVKQLAGSLMTGIEKRLSNLEKSNTLSLCTFLDPQYKHHVFEDLNTKDRIKKYAIQQVTNLISEANEMQEQHVVEDVHIQETNSPEPSAKTFSIWDDVDQTISKARPVGTPYSQAIQEVQRYFDDRPISRKDNPLAWWRNHQKVYPNLANIVRTHLNMVATSVPCERMFSKAGNIITDRRTRLSTKKVNQLMFLNANSKDIK